MPPRTTDCDKIETALREMTEQITVAQDVRIKVEHIHDTQIRHDLRLLALEENQRDAKEFRAYVRLKLEEMTALGVKVALIMGVASLTASGLIGLIIKKM